MELSRYMHQALQLGLSRGDERLDHEQSKKREKSLSYLIVEGIHTILTEVDRTNRYCGISNISLSRSLSAKFPNLLFHSRIPLCQ